MSKILRNLFNSKVNDNILPTDVYKSNIQYHLNDFEVVNWLKSRADSCKIQNRIKYIVIDSCSTEQLSQLQVFLNKSYNKYYHYQYLYKLQYSIDLLKYYTSSSCLVIFFYDTLTNQLIGTITGKKITIQVKETEQFSTRNVLEIKFLCVLENYRNKSVSNFFSYILCGEAKKRWNLQSGIFVSEVVSENPYMQCFDEKKTYFRPINYNKLKKHFLPNWLKSKIQEKIYTSFSYQQSFLNNYKLHYINPDTVTDDLVENIQKKLLDYYEKNYCIFNRLDISDIYQVLTNPSFTNFVFIDQSGDIIHFASFYKTDLKSHFLDIKCLYLYTCFFDNHQDITNVFESIHSYIYEHNIADLTTIYDIFGYSEKHFFHMKFLKCQNKNSYCTFNLQNLYRVPSYSNMILDI